MSARPRLSQLVAPVVIGAALSLWMTMSGSPATAAHGAVSPRDRWGTVWLCRPGLANDPCSSALATTVVARDGTTRIEQATPAKNPAVDCFYVYPTISDET